MEKQQCSARAKAAAARRRLRTRKDPEKKAAPTVDRRQINRQLATIGAGRDDWWTAYVMMIVPLQAALHEETR